MLWTAIEMKWRTWCRKCLNFSLNDTTLCYEMRKPFDVLVEGLPVQWSRGDKTPLELFVRAVAELQTPEIQLMKGVLGEDG